MRMLCAPSVSATEKTARSPVAARQRTKSCYSSATPCPMSPPSRSSTATYLRRQNLKTGPPSRLVGGPRTRHDLVLARADDDRPSQSATCSWRPPAHSSRNCWRVSGRAALRLSPYWSLPRHGPRAAHLRNRDIDPAVLTRLVQSIADVQEVSILHRQLWSRQIKFIEATIPAPGADTSTPPPLFQHANSRRIRWNRLQAARGARDFGAFLWASMVVPLYREVRRRANVTTEAEREAASPSFSHAYRAEQLKLLVQQARALVVAAVETHIQLFESTPGMALLASTSATGIADAFELFVDLVENCDLPRDDKVALLAAR